MTLGRAIRIAARIEASLLGALTLTGLYLTWFYRPTSTRLYSYGDISGLDASIRFAHLMRALHSASSSAFLWIGVALAGMCITALIQRSDAASRRATGIAVGFVVLAWGASVTGYLLPWDQLALKAVTVDSSLNGLWGAAFSDLVRFVIIGNREISQGTLRAFLLIHVLVLTPLLTGALLLAFFQKKSASQ